MNQIIISLLSGNKICLLLPWTMNHEPSNDYHAIVNCFILFSHEPWTTRFMNQINIFYLLSCNKLSFTAMNHEPRNELPCNKLFFSSAMNHEPRNHHLLSCRSAVHFFTAMNHEPKLWSLQSLFVVSSESAMNHEPRNHHLLSCRSAAQFFYSHEPWTKKWTALQ